jgi:hypothetical protein
MNSHSVFAWSMFVYHPSYTSRALYGMWINDPVLIQRFNPHLINILAPWSNKLSYFEETSILF